MNNRTLIYMTSLVVACMAALLFINLIPIFWPSKAEKYLSLKDVRGIDIEHHQIPYTLNFEQQNGLIEMLNMSIPIGFTIKKENELNIEKITIYRFGKPDLTIIPYGYEKDNLIFSIPDWNPDGLMQDISQGKLKQLLSKTYDS